MVWEARYSAAPTPRPLSDTTSCGVNGSRCFFLSLSCVSEGFSSSGLPHLNSSPLICTPPSLLYVLELRAGARRRAKLEASRLGVYGLSVALTQASRLKLSSMHHGSDSVTEAQAQKEGLPICEALRPPLEVSGQERKDLASEF